MLNTYRYGSPRSKDEGLRIGSARQVPRGVRREDWRRKNYFDLWVPLVAPSLELVAEYRHEKISFQEFARRYQSEMKSPASRQAIQLLAIMMHYTPISLGCFCEDETRCHRSVLKKLVAAAAESPDLSFVRKAPATQRTGEFSSPACSADFDDL